MNCNRLYEHWKNISWLRLKDLISAGICEKMVLLFVFFWFGLYTSSNIRINVLISSEQCGLLYISTSFQVLLLAKISFFKFFECFCKFFMQKWWKISIILICWLTKKCQKTGENMFRSFCILRHVSTSLPWLSVSENKFSPAFWGARPAFWKFFSWVFKFKLLEYLQKNDLQFL